MFSGSIPALVTPFRGGTFDEAAFRRLVDWQIENGSAALVPCGTTGEASTLSNAEHHRVIEVCIEQAAGRVPVIAGCGSNDTRNAQLHMNFAKKAGAAAAKGMTDNEAWRNERPGQFECPRSEMVARIKAIAGQP